MDTLQMIRKKWNNFMLTTKNIDTIMTNKVDDYILLEEQPLPIQVGKKLIWIGNFSFKNEHEFFNQWAMLISALSAKIINLELSEERRKEILEKCNFHLLGQGIDLMQVIYLDRWIFKKICKLISKFILKQKQYVYIEKDGTKKLIHWKNCSTRYFINNITKEKLIQICWLIYFFNFDASKKNLKLVAEKMNLKQLEQTYIPFWLQNLNGINGQFLNVLQENTDYSYEEKARNANGNEDNKTKNDDH